jgi:hypothetical protein
LIDPRERLRPNLQSNEKANLVGEVEFRFRIRDLERFDVRGRRPALARLDLQPFQLLWRQ